ncbi:hypothetical protein [Streptomyces cellostaticus]|uniref:hypothetical protein n=1 Tax=Streptomyces cellostaticus TaxID=67285 RepID=UPI0020269C96|nr:hypothetical protein [Streptomyces cellostaticus]
MTSRREQRGVFYDGDFGLSALTEKLSSSTTTVNEAQVLEFAAEVAAVFAGEGAVELGADLRCLLDSTVSAEAIRTAWLAATRQRFDPAASGTDAREWLGRLAALYPTRPPREARTSRSPRPRPGAEEGQHEAVVAEVRTSAPRLPERVPQALEDIVRHADAELGFRLLLRVLKAHALPVGKEQYDRFMALDTQFSCPGPMVYDGLQVLWPPLDTTRRDASGDFGLSALTSWFEGTWEGTAHTRVRQAAAADDSAQTPGSAAALLLVDVSRLLDSALHDDTLSTLWLAASGRGYNIDRLGIGARDWLKTIGDVCQEHLNKAAPAYTPVTPPARIELVDAVLRTVREATPLIAGTAVSTHWEAIPGTAAAHAVQEVVTRVDADLGYRLFLRLLSVLSVPLTPEQYAGHQVLAERLGLGEDHLAEGIEQLVCQERPTERRPDPSH